MTFRGEFFLKVCGVVPAIQQQMSENKVMQSNDSYVVLSSQYGKQAYRDYVEAMYGL